MYVTAKNVKEDGVHTAGITYVSKDIHEEINLRCNPVLGDILLIKDGATTGTVTVNNLEEPFSLLSSVAVIKLPHGCYNWYLVHFLRSDVFEKLIRSLMTGTGIPRITLRKIEPLLVPLPPLAEQSRIVAKIDELMPLIEGYGKLEDEREQLDSELPDHLRKSILQMAVQGKLVPQDPNDEPASVLLERIREERHELIKEGELKAPKGGESVIYRGSDGGYYEKRIGAKGHESEPVCIDDEIPFEIPESWEWSRFGAAVFNRDAERIPLSINERSRQTKKIYDYYGASGIIDTVESFLFDKPLLLIGEDGANLLNRTTPIAFIAHGKYWVNNHAHVLDGPSENYLEYIALHINAISLAPFVTGTAQPKMNQERMNSILLAIPPLEEQSRIVAKIEQLFQIM